MQHDRREQHRKERVGAKLLCRGIAYVDGQEVEARVIDRVEDVVGRARLGDESAELENGEKSTDHARCHEDGHDGREDTRDDLEESVAEALLGRDGAVVGDLATLSHSELGDLVVCLRNVWTDAHLVLAVLNDDVNDPGDSLYRVDVDLRVVLHLEAQPRCAVHDEAHVLLAANALEY